MHPTRSYSLAPILRKRSLPHSPFPPHAGMLLEWLLQCLLARPLGSSSSMVMVLSSVLKGGENLKDMIQRCR